MTSLRQNSDVIVVGAGTSGLSAAKALIQAGKDVLVLESGHQIGGRCITDLTTFSSPFDRGGSWFHSAEINPLAEIAENMGYQIHKAPWNRSRVMTKGRHLNDGEISDYSNYMETMWDHILKKGSEDDGISVQAALPSSEWRDTAKLFVAQLLGGDYDVTSAADLANYKDAEGDWLITDGLGSFIRDLHSEVPVSLNTPVSKIDYSGSRVRVTTPNGIAEADQLVLTVSVGVLAAESIEFVPALPNRKIGAIGNLPNGLLNKVGIEMDPAWKETFEGFAVDYHSGGEEYCTLAFNFCNTELATGFVAGRFAAELEKHGPGAATEFCLQALRETFGETALKNVLKTSETAWNGNPRTYGSYSYALPGCTYSREILAETIDEKVFFAGEATMPDAFATVHGAYLSGIAVAERSAMVGQNHKLAI